MRDVPFDPATVVRIASDVLSVKRVFGEPIERDGVTIIPVAKVMGGSGGGGQGVGPLAPHDATDAAGTSETSSDDAEVGAVRQTPATGSGGGSGLGVHVRPVGVYVVDSQGVHWRPALDLNRVILGGQVLGALVVLAVAHVLRKRR
ncbi:MAG TPA: spore germination protein GerW family protein [Cellulomonas sp.]|uniref:spore germination protein GerW family protein n=1 Tax=Cellulomonas sp. TaxID=40001 RepID=UPI002E32FE22|nr:spore germination protein GerW family protein [Cellulomonas sp.]HEX5332114.1 spore germination protein GerW family protein [Cellulomonas sp.]